MGTVVAEVESDKPELGSLPNIHVQRLRGRKVQGEHGAQWALSAADEIERLYAENMRLKATLRAQWKTARAVAEQMLMELE